MERQIEERTGEGEQACRARELAELLQELRVVLPGVQVLFAFLLTVPFSARFGDVSPLEQAVFFTTLLCTAVSAGLLIAPSAHHRLLWRQRAREHRLRVANRLAVAGMVLLVPGMVGALFVITDVLFGRRCLDHRVHHGLLPLCMVRDADAAPCERKVGSGKPRWAGWNQFVGRGNIACVTAT